MKCGVRKSLAMLTLAAAGLAACGPGMSYFPDNENGESVTRAEARDPFLAALDAVYEYVHSVDPDARVEPADPDGDFTLCGNDDRSDRRLFNFRARTVVHSGLVSQQWSTHKDRIFEIFTEHGYHLAFQAPVDPPSYAYTFTDERKNELSIGAHVDKVVVLGRTACQDVVDQPQTPPLPR